MVENDTKPQEVDMDLEIPKEPKIDMNSGIQRSHLVVTPQENSSRKMEKHDSLPAETPGAAALLCPGSPIFPLEPPTLLEDCEEDGDYSPEEAKKLPLWEGWKTLPLQLANPPSIETEESRRE